MTDQNKTTVLFPFISLFTLAYFAWISIWKHNPDLSSWGGTVFTTAACLITLAWLARAAKRSSGERRTFWILLTLGSFSYSFAEMIWLYEDVVLGTKLPSPGWTDFFFILQIVCYLAAFIYPFTQFERSYRAFKLLFDVLIIMTAATAFSWHYLIGPLLQPGKASILELSVSLFYPIGNLGLLFGAVSLYWGSRQVVSDKPMLLVVGGLIIQAISNSIYLYQVSADSYFMGNLVDPLFTLSLLLIGGAGALQTTEKNEKPAGKEEEDPRRFDLVRLSLPYVNVIVLFIFMITGPGKFDALTVGCAISIMLVITRQMFILLENRRLLNKLYDKTEELEISEQRYRSLFDYHPDAAYSLDMNGKFDSVNTTCANLLGYNARELIGLSYSSFIQKQDFPGLSDDLKQLREGIPLRQEFTVKNRAGLSYEVSIISVPIRVKDKIVGIFGIGRDITENKKNEERIRHLAYHDPLTDLTNRAAFDELLKKALFDAQLYQEQLAVAFIDLDRFKSVNDTLGHDVGDSLLLSVANRLKACMREGDTVARQGGDEFTLILREVSGLEDVKERARRILEELSRPHNLNGRVLNSTPSIGIALYPSDDNTAVGLMKKADIALYQAKEGGRGCYKLFGESAPSIFDKISLENDIVEAIARNELLLHYQPQVDADTNSLIGAEACLRWNRPGFGLLKPDVFMQAAEATGMNLAIDEWTLREACRQAKIWSDEGMPVKITINLSPHQFEQDSLAMQLQQILEESGTSPELIQLELSVSAIIAQPKMLAPKLQEIKMLGISVSVDGCGENYAALSALENIPIDTLKLDSSLTVNLESGPVRQSITASIAGLAKTLQLHIAAEGIENEEQALLLRSLARFGMQGPLFGEAVPPAEIASLARHALGS
ncbi:DUF4084 domain-containing protein [Saccharibacillus kuerlensis]|uniref:Diguanylate cyclase n=1 Tax=Saccharibacillus kuerlensis TaxID=459527 RepID=A0ABQ2L2N4_9BACL|nr:DUF4084 domain-containing protein [Saccharibacillus kuerlensis]GGO00514.1 diguanylate cyclase [Saccharibacillus kuerlensis]